MISLFDTILKEVPLYTRIKVYLEMEYLNLMIQPDGCCTEEEFKAANEWSEKNAHYIIREIQKWQDDGAPLELREKE